MGFDFYKLIWSHLGGRPWTYIYRDFYHKYEIFIQAQWFWTTVLILWGLGVSIPARILLFGWAIYIFGYINGHFFWGSPWKPGETPDCEE